MMDGPTYTSGWEGRRHMPYDDATGLEVPVGGAVKGTLTCGIGHTGRDVVIGELWPDSRIDATYQRDYSGAVEEARADVPCFAALGPVRQAAVFDCCFELGQGGFGKFRETIAALCRQDWQGAHDDLLASRYAVQVPARACANAGIFLTGTWPEAPIEA